jgi:hypothetical protein
VDPVPDPLLLRKSGSAGNRTQDLQTVYNWTQIGVCSTSIFHSPVYLTGSGCIMLHGAAGLSSQIRSTRFVVMGTRNSPAASRSVCRGFHVLYITRLGSVPTRDPGGRVLTNHAACVSVLEMPVMITFESISGGRHYLVHKCCVSTSGLIRTKY